MGIDILWDYTGEQEKHHFCLLDEMVRVEKVEHNSATFSSMKKKIFVIRQSIPTFLFVTPSTCYYWV